MSESDPLAFGSVMQWLTTLATSLLAFIGVRLHNRVDKLQDGSVTRAELKEIQDQNRLDRVNLHGENLTRLERIESKIDVQVAIVQRLTYVEAELERLRDWKHEVIDPYIPGEFSALKIQVNRIEHRTADDPPRRRSSDL